MLIAAIVTVGSVAAVVWLIHSSGNPVDTATVYAGYLAAVAIGVTLLMALGAWRGKDRASMSLACTPGQAAAAADRLADLMAASLDLSHL